MGLQIDLLRQSFALIAQREPEVTRRFYQLLFTSYPQTRSLFQGIDQRAQERMLRDTLVAVLEHLEDPRWLKTQLIALGARHARYGVTEEMYDWVGACLLRALGDAAGDDWTSEIAAAWLDAYLAIADTMKLGALDAGAVPGRELASEPTSSH